MPTFSITDMASGSPLPGLAGQVATAAKNKMCSLYNSNPGWFLTADFFGLRRGILNSFCEPPAVPPATWEAKCNSQYAVTFTPRWRGADYTNNSCKLYESPQQTVFVWGPIYAIKVGGFGSLFRDFCGVVNGGTRIEIYCHGSGSNRTPDPEYAYFGVQSTPLVVGVQVNSVTEVSGSQTCLPFSIPQPRDNIPPDNDQLDDETPINYGPGLDITVPLVYVDSLLDANVRFEVGPFNVDFNLGGVDVGFNPEFNFYLNPSPPSPIPPGTPPVALPPGGPTEVRPNPPVRTPELPGTCPDYSGILKDIKRETDKIPSVKTKTEDIKKDTEKILECLECGKEFRIVPLEFAKSQAHNVEFNEEVIQAQVSIIDLPKNAKNQFGGPGAPNVYFVGWYSWRYGNFQDERLPIDYLSKNLFPPKRNPTGLVVSLYEGCTGSLTAFQKIPVTPS